KKAQKTHRPEGQEKFPSVQSQSSACENEWCQWKRRRQHGGCAHGHDAFVVDFLPYFAQFALRNEAHEAGLPKFLSKCERGSGSDDGADYGHQGIDPEHVLVSGRHHDDCGIQSSRQEKNHSGIKGSQHQNAQWREKEPEYGNKEAVHSLFWNASRGPSWVISNLEITSRELP